MPKSATEKMVLSADLPSSAFGRTQNRHRSYKHCTWTLQREAPVRSSRGAGSRQYPFALLGADMFLPMPKRREKDPHAVALGTKGGKARIEKMTPEHRREVARKAALARWAKRKKDQQKTG
jgi:hypothetical protein